MSELLIDKRDNVGIVTLNRPDNMNALTYGMIKGLISYFQEAEQDDSIRAILLRAPAGPSAPGPTSCRARGAPT